MRNVSTNQWQLYKLFAGNKNLWGFKYNKSEMDLMPREFDISSIRYIAECEADSSQYLHKLFYPCIFLTINDDRWHFFACKEHDIEVMDDINELLGFNDRMAFNNMIRTNVPTAETFA